jgi:hypothetical protein
MDSEEGDLVKWNVAESKETEIKPAKGIMIINGDHTFILSMDGKFLIETSAPEFDSPRFCGGKILSTIKKRSAIICDPTQSRKLNVYTAIYNPRFLTAGPIVKILMD